jgi:riboflavin kinase / FMN adenylyltransferase
VQIHSTLATVLKPTAVALGNFDGVHCGHQQVIQLVLQASSGLVPTIVSFHPHPQEFFSGQPRHFLSTVQEKAQVLGELGIEQLVLLNFNQALSKLTPPEFVEKILHQQLAARHITIGADFHFGYQRQGNAALLKSLAANYGIETNIVELAIDQNARIGSSRIRSALLNRDLAEVSRLLGRSYSISGRVVAGQQLGRTLGFPTANIEYPPEKFLPHLGVYCVRVHTEHHQELPAVMNIGKRPTVNGQSVTVEVHLLNWSGDLYNQQITLHLDRFLRSEQKFAGLNELTAQIQADCTAANSFYQEMGKT